MNLAEFAINKRVVIQFIVVLLMLGGMFSYGKMGKLEDPEFTLKTALVVTRYPGASALQVEKEVTDRLETAIQQMESLNHVRSMSKQGESVIWVDIKEEKKAGQLPQIWDDLRKKMRDVTPLLPPGTQAPIVRDDFSDVYGVFLAITSDGYSYAELEDYVDSLKRELLLVNDVAKVEVWGQQRECVYVEMSRASLSDLGIAPGVVLAALDKQNLVVDAGSVNVGRERLRFDIGGEFDSVESIGNLVISGAGSDRMVLLRDVADIRLGYVEPAMREMRFNGQPALGLAVSTVSGGNVITMGEGVKARLKELVAFLPVGIEVEVVAMQSDVVQASINEFMVNLSEALAIVVALLLIFMGMRSGVLIGGGLVLTIAATFVVMRLWGIDLQRVSLGALIIALGMLVDNAIVVTEGILVKMQRGLGRLESAKETISETAWPLLGATLVAVFAFLPIYLAENNTGEYCESLFLVVAFSLMISWIMAMTVTPLWCYLWLKVGKGQEGEDPYAGKWYLTYRKGLEWCLHHRLITVCVMVALLTTAIVNFKYVDKTFFPQSRRPQLIVDYWLPEGAQIDAVSSDTRLLEKQLLEHEGVEDVATFVGSGSSRFYLALEPEYPVGAYGQLILNLTDAEALPAVEKYTQDILESQYPYAEPRVRRFPLGPSTKFKVEVRFTGPDSAVLHRLGDQAKKIMQAELMAKDVRDDWRDPVKAIDVAYSQARGLRTGLTRENIGQALKRGFDGFTIGVYRKDNDLLPVVMRAPESERKRVDDLAGIEVFSTTSAQGVPLGQLVSHLGPVWEEPIIRRRDHRRTLIVQCDPRVGTAETLRQKVKPAIEAITLPAGYGMEWGGLFDESNRSRAYVFKGLPVSFVLMAFVVVALFNAFKQPLVIASILPLSIIGITAGLLLTGQPFGFLSLLGALSLAGMLIKNAVILIDQTDADIKEGKRPYVAIVDSAVSRIRPVLMAALSTVLGMIPLLMDKFWVSMAVTIIFGLTFATILTLIVVPVLYSVYFGIEPE